MNESSHQKRYKSSSTSMSMTLAEASIQSLLDFLRLNLWIWFDGFHKGGSLDKGKGRGGEGGGGLERIENEGEKWSITAWTILCAKNAELSSSTVKLDLSLMQKQRATHKIIAMFLCFCFCFCFHLHLLAWIHARQQLFYFGKLKKRSLGPCLVFTWLMHSNASLLAILPRKTPG